MGQTQLDIPEELDIKIGIVQAKNNFSRKTEAILWILEKALSNVETKKLSPDMVQKIEPQETEEPKEESKEELEI